MTIVKLLSGCVESLRISEYWAATAAREIEMQKEFMDCDHQMYKKWYAVSHASFLRASEKALQWRQRAEIEFLEARKMGYDGPFDRLSMRPSPARWLRQ